MYRRRESSMVVPPIIPSLGRLRWEDGEFEASLVCRGILFPNDIT
jgi:hypothetical protein